jgi:hypothetical protein
MPSRRQTPIPLTEYLADALRHIEAVTGQIQQTIRGARRLKADLRRLDPRIFGRTCALEADFLPRPFGRTCAGGPEVRAPREKRSARPRRPSGARRRVKR